MSVMAVCPTNEKRDVFGNLFGNNIFVIPFGDTSTTEMTR